MLSLRMDSLPLVLLMSNISISRSDSTIVKFLLDFYEEKNFMITANFCWNYRDLTVLLKSLSNQNNHKLTSIYNNPTNYNGFLNYLATNNYFFLDLNNCEQSWNILQEVNQNCLFRFPLKWLLLVTSSNFSLLVKNLKTYPIFPSSHVVVAKRKENSFELLHPYRIDQTRDIVWEDYGEWCPEKGLRENLRYIPATQRRSNLQQANMNVSMLVREKETWNHLEDLKYPSVDMFIKQSWMTVKSLFEYCNISYHFVQTRDFGYLNKATGIWSGVVGDLLYGRAQFAGSTPLLTRERVEAVDFLVMVYPSQIRFVLRKPPLSYMSNIFVLPFYWTVWIATLLILSLFAIALFIVLNWETKYKQMINFQNNFGINDILLITFETLCQQGTMTEPRSMSGRTISLISLSSCMFLYVAYSANIVALLQSTTEITSLEQLLNSRIAVGAQKVYYMTNYLTNAKDVVRQELYRKKIGSKGFYPLEEGLERVRQGFFALHMELGSGYHHVLQTFTDYEVCSLQELEGYAKAPGGYGCVPKNSPYKEIIKVGHLKIEEYGIRRRNYNRVFKKPKCYSQGASFDSVGIMDAHPAIMLWVYGVILAVLTFSMEKVLEKIKLKKHLLKQQVQAFSEAEMSFDFY